MKDLQPRNQGIGTVEETSGSLQRWWRGRNDDLKRQPFLGERYTMKKQKIQAAWSV
jgi:hypothetical protein